MRIRRKYEAALRRLRAMRRGGLRGAWSLAKYEILEHLSGPATVTMKSRYAARPLRCRRHSSDAKVFYDIFAMREYAPLDGLRNVGLILDCGANVGFSSAYFLSRYPGANVIAVEPDASNFQMLSRNLSPWGDQVTLVQAGIWSRPCQLVFSNDQYRDGREWAVQVREAAEGETGQIKAIDVGTLLKDSGRDRISLLKMDIEESEKVVFASNYQSWIDRVDNIAIELHDAECERVFFSAIEGMPFDISRSGELTICRKK